MSTTTTTVIEQYRKNYPIQYDVVLFVTGYIRMIIEPLLMVMIPGDIINTIITQCSAKIYTNYHYVFTDISLPLCINNINNNNNNFTQYVYKSGSNLYIETNKHNLLLYKMRANKFLKHPFFSNKLITFVSNSLYTKHIFIATKHDNEIYAFGDDTCSQLGVMRTDDRTKDNWDLLHDQSSKVSKPTPIKLPSNTNYKIISITTGLNHSIFLTECGKVLSCGENNYGQCGQPSKYDINQITLIQSLENIIKTSCGQYQTLCLNNNGKVYGFGFCLNEIDDNYKKNKPLLIDLKKRPKKKKAMIVDIKSGEQHCCLLDKSGMVCMLYKRDVYWMNKYDKHRKLNFKKIDSGKDFSLLLATNNKVYKIVKFGINKGMGQIKPEDFDFDGKLDTEIINGVIVAGNQIYLVVL